MTLVDLLKLPQVSRPALSPDGSRVVYVVSEPDWKVRTRVPHLYRAGVDGSNPSRLTQGDGEDQPAWSPDGGTIAFLARVAQFLFVALFRFEQKRKMKRIEGKG